MDITHGLKFAKASYFRVYRLHTKYSIVYSKKDKYFINKFGIIGEPKS